MVLEQLEGGCAVTPTHSVPARCRHSATTDTSYSSSCTRGVALYTMELLNFLQRAAIRPHSLSDTPSPCWSEKRCRSVSTGAWTAPALTACSDAEVSDLGHVSMPVEASGAIGEAQGILTLKNVISLSWATILNLLGWDGKFILFYKY